MGEITKRISPSRRQSALRKAVRRNRRLRLLTAISVAAASLPLVLAAAIAMAGMGVHDVIGNGADGSATGQFDDQNGVAANDSIVADGSVDPTGSSTDGYVYVADEDNHRVQVFDATGSFRFMWGKDVIDPSDPGDTGTGSELCVHTQICKSGDNSASTGPGEFDEVQDVTIDQSTGDVYVTDEDNARIQKFDAAGHFLLMIGRNVNQDGLPAPNVCLAGDVCKNGVDDNTEASFSTNFIGHIAVDPNAPHSLYVADDDQERIQVFSASGVFLRMYGYGVDDGGNEPQVCTSGCQAGISDGAGSVLGQIDEAIDVALDDAGRVYYVDDDNENVIRFDDGVSFENPVEFAPADLSGQTQMGLIEIDEGAEAGTSDDRFFALQEPENENAYVKELDLEGNLVDTHGENSGIDYVDGGGGVGYDPGAELLYLSSQQDAFVYALAAVTAPVATVNPVADADAHEATFTGEVDPNGAPTSYRFEYVNEKAFQLSGFENAIRVPAVGIPLGNGDAPVAVEQTVTDLKAATTYRVRIVATQLFGPEETNSAATAFATDVAVPTVAEQLPTQVTQHNATLRAKVNPNGLPTTYRFEWGAESSFGNSIPADHELFVGAGSDPVTVSASLSGLQQDVEYHFRVVANNAAGTTAGDDRVFSTMNTDGLTWGRRYELVSPPDKGPAGQAGEQIGFGGNALQYQAASDGGGIAYAIANGLEEATFGGEVTYRSDRTAQGWLTQQVSPSLTDQQPPIQQGPSNTYGRFNQWLSSDLQCGFSISSLPLSGNDAAALEVTNAGGFSLYRRDQGGAHTLVTDSVPTNLHTVSPFPSIERDAYTIPGAAESCGRLLFETLFEYPGVAPTVGADGGKRLYEWNEGILSNPAGLPVGGGEESPSSARPGVSRSSDWNALSEDGSRFFFTSRGQGTSSPLGRDAVFLREDGQPPVEVSGSQTGTPNDGDSRYQMATPSGDHVFFIARYGLAGNGTSSGATTCNLSNNNGTGIGCDLYRYSVESDELIDVTPSSNPEDTAGASVAGVLHASNDGSRVYFAAKGQLVPDEGQTFAENDATGTRGYNLYLWDSGALSYITTVSQEDVNDGHNAGLLVSPPSEQGNWSSRTNPIGDSLIFQSEADITGVGGTVEAYHYSTEAGEVECVSCRRDGQPSLGAIGNPLLAIGDSGSNPTHPMKTLSADGTRVFFQKSDALAPGAPEGETNLYEWRGGQISLLVAGSPEVSPESRALFRGASEDGASVFFRSKRKLTPRDTDRQQDVYVARIGGGFAPPPEPSEPCDPLSESCAGESDDPKSRSMAPGSPASSDFFGPGNLRKARCGRYGRQAKRLSNRAKRLARSAKRAGRNNRGHATRMSRTANRLAKRATRLSKRAKRCRTHTNRQVNTNRRAGQ